MIYTIVQYTIPSYTFVLYTIVLYTMILYNVVLFTTILYTIVLIAIVLYIIVKYILNNSSIERRIINDVKIALSMTVFEIQNTEEIKTKYRLRPICMLSLVLVAKAV